MAEISGKPEGTAETEFNADDIQVFMKAVVSGWHYFQSPNSYSREERAFVFERLDDAYRVMRSHPSGRDVA